MKRFYSFLLLLSLLLSFSVPVLAHPGRLDSNGGHHDRIHGGYHYHRGENAGQAQYDDKEYTTRKTNYTYTYTTAEREESKSKIEKQESNKLNVFQILLIIAIIGTLVYVFVGEFLLSSISLYRKNKRNIQIYGKRLKKRCVDCEFCNWYWYHPFYKYGKYGNLMKQKIPKYCKKIRKPLNSEHNLRCIINDLDFAEFEEETK